MVHSLKPQCTSSFSHLQMTFAMRLGIHSQAGYGFYVKLTPMSLLEQQLNPLSVLERQIMYSLATNQQLTTITNLANILPHISRSHFLQAIEKLYSRSLIEKKAGKYILQPVVIEYVTEQFKPKPGLELVNKNSQSLGIHSQSHS